jgi:hypothetical protein
LNSLLFTNIVINKSVYICKESSLKASLVAQYVINLTEFNDRTLKTAMNDVPENSVILFEDIDCMKAGNRRPDSNEWIENQPSSIATEKANPAAGFAVTLSGLLNVLDGFHGRRMSFT